MSIQIKVVSAQLTRDTEFFSNMDPYCVLKLGSQTQRTKTKDEAGKKPVWNEKFRFTNPDNNLRVVILDEDNVADDEIGSGDVNLSKFRSSGVEQQEIVQLYFKGRAAGKVLLRITGGGNQTNINNQWGQGNTQPNNQWGSNPQQNNQWGGGTQPQNQWGNSQPPNNQWGNNQPPNNQWGNNQPSNNQWGGNQPQNNQWAQNNNWNQQQQGTQWTSTGNNQWGSSPQQNNQWGGNQPQKPNQFNNNVPNNNQWGNGSNSFGNNKPINNNNQGGYPDLQYKPPISDPNVNPLLIMGQTLQSNNFLGVNPNTNPNPNPNPNINPNFNSNNNNQFSSNSQGLNLPYQIIGGMQGLLKPNNNPNQPGSNPYAI